MNEAIYDVLMKLQDGSALETWEELLLDAILNYFPREPTHFPEGKGSRWNLHPETIQRLRAFVDRHRDEEGLFFVRGHASSTPTQGGEDNRSLSNERASTISELLVFSFDVPLERVCPTGSGDLLQQLVDDEQAVSVLPDEVSGNLAYYSPSATSRSEARENASYQRADVLFVPGSYLSQAICTGGGMSLEERRARRSTPHPQSDSRETAEENARDLYGFLRWSLNPERIASMPRDQHKLREQIIAAQEYGRICADLLPWDSSRRFLPPRDEYSRVIDVGTVIGRNSGRPIMALEPTLLSSSASSQRQDDQREDWIWLHKHRSWTSSLALWLSGSPPDYRSERRYLTVKATESRLINPDLNHLSVETRTQLVRKAIHHYGDLWQHWVDGGYDRPDLHLRSELPLLVTAKKSITEVCDVTFRWSQPMASVQTLEITRSRNVERTIERARRGEVTTRTDFVGITSPLACEANYDMGYVEIAPIVASGGQLELRDASLASMEAAEIHRDRALIRSLMSHREQEAARAGAGLGSDDLSTYDAIQRLLLDTREQRSSVIECVITLSSAHSEWDWDLRDGRAVAPEELAVAAPGALPDDLQAIPEQRPAPAEPSAAAPAQLPSDELEFLEELARELEESEE